MSRFQNQRVFLTHYDNSIDALIPELWARESIAILTENMRAAELVHRDFEDEFAAQGDFVNTRKPTEFIAKRKGVNDDVTVQNAESTNVAVPLDQHVHVAFLIRDGEEQKSMVDLIETYLRPAMIAMARIVDQIVLGQYAQFLDNQAGVGALTTSNAAAAVTATRNVQNKKKVPMENRSFILTPDTETMFLQNEAFFTFEKTGSTEALREASMGRRFGYNLYMCQNMASVSADSAGTGAGTINNSPAGYVRGDTVLTVANFSANECLAGNWIKIGNYVYHVTADNDSGSGATEITIDPPLFATVAHAAAITVYPTTTVDQSVSPTGYAAGYQKYIVLDAVAAGENLAVGRIVSFAEQTHKYVIVDTNGSTTVMLDRPLEAAVADADVMNFGPSGDFNLAFTRNAMTLVIRPMAPPPREIATSMSWNGVTVRVVITYEGRGQGHLVTLDFLAGIKVLDEDLGAVLVA